MNFDVLQDEEKALECFKKFGPLYGVSEVIQFNLMKSYPQYDPQDLIQYWIDLAVSVGKQDMLYPDVAWYYLFFKNDLYTAVKYFWKIQDFYSFKVEVS